MARSRTAGFSLSELLVVIAVILILLSLLSVGVSRSYTEAERLQCQQNLEQLGLACQMWSNEHDGHELAAVDTTTGRSTLWFKALAPYLSKTGGAAETVTVLNCPQVADRLPGAGGGDGGEVSWSGGPDILFSYDRYRSWFDFIGIVQDLREAGWPGTIHMLERHPQEQSGVFNSITPHIDSYGIFTYIDAWYGKQFTGDELAAVKRFQQDQRSIFVSADHYASFTQVNNQLADYCGWGLYNWDVIDRGNNGQPYQPICDHPIGAGVTLFRGYNSEGQIQIPSDPSKQNQYASLVLFSGLIPNDAITGVLDDGKVRMVMEANWTKFASPGWSYGGEWKEDHFRYVQNIYNWLLERSSSGVKLTYGYNNEIGGRDPATGRLRPRPAHPSRVIRILDYEDFIADHDGRENDDPEYFIALRHGGRANVLFVDGHVEPLHLEEITEGNWGRWRVDR